MNSRCRKVKKPKFHKSSNKRTLKIVGLALLTCSRCSTCGNFLKRDTLKDARFFFARKASLAHQFRWPVSIRRARQSLTVPVINYAQLSSAADKPRKAPAKSQWLVSKSEKIRTKRRTAIKQRNNQNPQNQSNKKKKVLLFVNH